MPISTISIEDHETRCEVCRKRTAEWYSTKTLKELCTECSDLDEPYYYEAVVVDKEGLFEAIPE